MREYSWENWVFLIVNIFAIYVFHRMEESNLCHHLLKLRIELQPLSLFVKYKAELVSEVECASDRSFKVTVFTGHFGTASTEVLHELFSLHVNLSEFTRVFSLHELVPLVYEVQRLV